MSCPLVNDPGPDVRFKSPSKNDPESVGAVPEISNLNGTSTPLSVVMVASQRPAGVFSAVLHAARPKQTTADRIKRPRRRVRSMCVLLSGSPHRASVALIRPHRERQERADNAGDERTKKRRP